MKNKTQHRAIYERLTIFVQIANIKAIEPASSRNPLFSGFFVFLTPVINFNWSKIMQLDPDNPKKEYTGVWIPKCVMESTVLSPMDKLVYGEIACFSECYGSNKWLGQRIGRSEHTASRSVSNLVNQGFVKFVGQEGNIRKLVATPKMARVAKNGKGGSQKWLGGVAKNGMKDNIKDNNKNIDTKVSNDETSLEILEKPKEIIRSERSMEIDRAIEIWGEVFGYPLRMSKTERRSINSILRRKDMDLDKLRQLLILVKKSRSDKYKRFTISNFTDLMYKTNELIAWAHEKVEQQQAKKELMAEI